MIIDEKKVVFIDITKTAGTSIRTIFSKYTNNKIYHHHFLNNSVDILNLNKMNYERVIVDVNSFKDYFKFTIVRNPYNKLYSYFNWFHKIAKVPSNHKIFYLIYSNDFNEFVSKIYLNWDKFKKHIDLKPMNDWITDNNNNILVDKIYYFEDLKNCWKDICDKININDELPYLKSTNIILNLNELTQKTIDIINDLYDVDFKRFNYDKIQYSNVP